MTIIRAVIHKYKDSITCRIKDNIYEIEDRDGSAHADAYEDDFRLIS
jgi:hypothetical protein